MIEHLPVLIIVTPLICALLTLLAGKIKEVVSWYIVMAVTCLCFAGSLLLMGRVLAEGRISYWLGNWEPPWGIEYAVDYLNGFVLVVLTLVAFLTTIYAKNSIDREIERKRIPFFYTIYLLFITGLMGMVITGDIFNLYVFLEIASLTGYALIAMGRKREALVASFNYLVMGTIGATFILLGIGNLYMVTGTLNMADLGMRLPALYESKVVHTAFAFFMIGTSIKVALFPLHNWLPRAYTYAPSTVSALLAATGTKVGAYVMIRVFFGIFQPEYLFAGIQMNHIILVLSCAAILAGSILAVAQTDIKKMLAYSSVGQIGYLVLGVSLLNVTGFMGSMLHILNHALMKGTLFLVAGIVVYRYGITRIENFRGLGRKLPLPMAAFTVASLSMIGIPLTVGFVSKWYLAIGALEAGLWYIIPILLLSSLLMAVYFWRVIDNIYFQEAETGFWEPLEQGCGKVPAMMVAPALVASGLCIYFGVFASYPLTVVEKAANILLK